MLVFEHAPIPLHTRADPYNGCSNQAFALTFNGTKEVMEYMMCPVGIHEGEHG